MASLPPNIRCPQAITEDHLAVLARLPLALGKDPPAQGSRPQQPEERRASDHSGQPLRAIVPANGDPALVVQSELLEDVGFPEPIVVVGHAGTGADDSGFRIAVVEEDELVRFRHRKRTQQHRVDDRKDGGVGADAEGQSEKRGQCKGAVLDEKPHREHEVLAKTFHKEPIRIGDDCRSAAPGQESRLG